MISRPARLHRPGTWHWMPTGSQRGAPLRVPARTPRATAAPDQTCWKPAWPARRRQWKMNGVGSPIAGPGRTNRRQPPPANGWIFGARASMCSTRRLGNRRRPVLLRGDTPPRWTSVRHPRTSAATTCRSARPELGQQLDRITAYPAAGGLYPGDFGTGGNVPSVSVLHRRSSWRRSRGFAIAPIRALQLRNVYGQEARRAVPAVELRGERWAATQACVLATATRCSTPGVAPGSLAITARTSGLPAVR